jgi:hypothetical protein
MRYSAPAVRTESTIATRVICRILQ